MRICRRCGVSEAWPREGRRKNLLIWTDEADADIKGRPPIVRAPFRKPSHALLAMAFIAGVTLAPTVLERVSPADPARVYQGVPANYAYHLIGDEIATPGDVDVLIVGASDSWTALDPRIIREHLEERYGRPMRVLNLSTNWPGEERNAQVVHDMLQDHNVHLLLMPETSGYQTAPHELAHHWWRGALPTKDLPPANRAQLYVMSVVGLPRQLWARFQSPETAPLTDTYRYYYDAQRTIFGFNDAQTGWLSHLETDASKRRPYESIDAPAPVVSDDDVFYSGEPDRYFEVRAPSYTPLQTVFTLMARDMVRAQGGVFATFSIPTHFQGAELERAWLHEHAGVERDWPTIGLSMTNLFPGMTFDEMLSYYGNESHLNSSGARAYTRALLPAIERLYAEATPG
jgi:hypothetical protein